MQHKNDSSGFSNLLFIKRPNRDDEKESVVTKRESKEFPSLCNRVVELSRNGDPNASNDSESFVNVSDSNKLNLESSLSSDKIKYKTVWMGPGGGYSIMEEYTEPRKCLEKEVPKELEMEFTRFRQLGQYSNRSNSNMASNSSVEILNSAETMKEDNYIFKSSGSLVNVDWSKTNSVGPLPYQNKVAIGNRSCLGRNLIPL